MSRSTPPPKLSPHAQDAQGAIRKKPGPRGTEVYEIEVESERPPAMSKRQTLPVPAPDALPGPQPSEKVPTRPGETDDTATVRPPTRAQRGLERTSTAVGLGFGPSPAMGGDTDFDPGEHDHAPLRRTSSFERHLSEPPLPIAEPSDPLDLGLAEAPGPAFDAPANEALDLVGRLDAPSIAPAEPSKRADPLSELRERYALGDFSGALTIAEAILEDDAQNADAQRYAESCRDVLKQMYAARLGPLDQVPIVAVPAEQLRWLTLDHRAGFLLSHVDGVSTLEEILDISGMPHLEAMRIIYELLQQKVIVLQ